MTKRTEFKVGYKLEADGTLGPVPTKIQKEHQAALDAAFKREYELRKSLAEERKVIVERELSKFKEKPQVADEERPQRDYMMTVEVPVGLKRLTMEERRALEESWAKAARDGR
jgi:hypothetical protein